MKKKLLLKCCDVLLLNECHIASAKQIFVPELIPAKTKGDKMKSYISLQKTNKILFSVITPYYFMFSL